jgi:hypothetical protein
MEICIAIVLSDAGMAMTSKDAHIKFENEYAHKDLIFNLFELFQDYCFAVSPQAYIAKNGARKGLIKSY